MSNPDLSFSQISNFPPDMVEEILRHNDDFNDLMLVGPDKVLPSFQIVFMIIKYAIYEEKIAKKRAHTVENSEGRRGCHGIFP